MAAAENAGPISPQARAIGAQGIVVPKRSALIMGLDHQFKLRNANKSPAAGLGGQRPSAAPQAVSVQQPQVAQPAQLAPVNASPMLQQASQVESLQQPANSAPKPARFVPNILWLAGQRRQQQHNHNHASQQQYRPSVFVDRHQQEILAANPNILTSTLLTRSDAPSASNHQSSDSSLGQPPLSNLTLTGKQQQVGGSNGDHQQYRGFSLIELEVRSDSDRRYVQDLYGNLSAVLNEQAQNPNALTVSPYVDVDFWSFKPTLDDHVDIMVSPKSRAFILGQLSRAKIRHRVKIDDIQSKLAQLSPQQAASGLGQQQQQQQQLQMSGKSEPATQNQLSGRVGHNQQPQVQASNTVSVENSGRSDPIATSSQPVNESTFFENYQRLADINQYLESIVEKNRDVARVQVIGRSSQGRYLRVLKLGYDQQDIDGSTGSLTASVRNSNLGDSTDAGKAPQTNGTFILENFFRRQESARKLGSIWLDGGTHAREWISPATVLYLAFRLSDNHYRCSKFFDTMRVLVHQQQQQAYFNAQQRQARSYRTPPAPGSGNLDADLLPSINEINSSLLGKPIQMTRPRTELEHTLELLAKQPQEVASEYGCDLDLDQLLRRYTFYIQPVLNPDGYEYSHTHNRLWRKTRSTSSHPIYRHFCLGADPNRNYDARHGSTGSSSHPCSQTYGGTVPFTEPETRHQSNFVYANRIGMKMYISFHSYSQMILLPFSHSKQLAPDHKDLESVGQAAVKAIERTHGTIYRVGPSASILYTASGTASDWAYEKAGIKYSYTIELRDTGSFGFLLPRNQIVPTGEETFNGVLAMIEQMEKNDNLLTSKSIKVPRPAAASTGPMEHKSSGNATVEIVDYNHVPVELEQMGALAKHKSRPPLENAIDGSDTWAAPAPMPTGVRDRGPQAIFRDPPISDSNMIDPNSLMSGTNGIFASGLDFSSHRLDDEPTGDEPEPDSGYAFEGEGELLEPTRENIVEAAKITEARLSGRLDSTRRIVQSAGLTASGRNYINSPLLASRTTPSIPRREVSDEIATEKTRSIVV